MYLQETDISRKKEKEVARPVDKDPVVRCVLIDMHLSCMVRHMIPSYDVT